MADFNATPQSTEEYNALFDFNLDYIAKGYLTETARWAKFLAIVAFIGFGLILVGSAYMSYKIGEMSYSSHSSPGNYIFIVYAILVALYFYPVLALLKFGTKTKPALEQGNQHLLNDGLRYLRGMFRYMGVITIIMISLYALVFFTIVLQLLTR